MTQPNDPTGATPPPGDATQPLWAAPSSAAASAAPAGSAPARPPETIPPLGHDVPVAPVTTVRRPSRRRGVVDVVLVVAAIFALGGVGFAVGRVTAPASQASAAASGRFGGQLPGSGGTGSGQGGFGAAAGGFLGGGGAGITISGEVTAITAEQLTLKLASGQTIQIALNGSTAYHTQAAASASDVTTGSTVQVQVTGGAGNGGTGNGGTGNGGTGTGGTGTGRLNLGAASSVTVVPK